MNKALKEQERQEAITNLLRWLKPGDQVFTISRDRNGNQHTVHIVLNDTDFKHDIRDITYLVAKACGFRRTRDNVAITQGGYGYSKSFQIVYSLGSALWPNGTPQVHGMRNGEPDREGGYALKHRSM